MPFNTPGSRRILTAALLSTLLISGLAGTMLVRTVWANPYINKYPPYYNPYMSKPQKVPPPNPTNVDIQNPQSNASYKGNNVSLWVSVANLSDVYRMYCYLDGREITVPQGSSFNVYLTDLSEGSHTVKVSVSNQKIQKQTIVYYVYSGGYLNPNLVSLDVLVCSDRVWSDSEVSFRVDNTAPRVSVLSPQEGTHGSEVLFDFMVDEATRHVVYSLDGQANVTTSGNTMLKGLSNGEHTVTVYAWDEAGNVGASEPITFTVATFPTTFVVVAVVVSAVVVATGLLFYFKKRKR